MKAPDAEPALNFRIFNSISLAGPLQWEHVAGGNLFLRTEYLTAIERAGLAGLSYRYAVISRGQTPVGLFYFQLADLSSREMGSFLNFEGYGDLVQSAGNRMHQLLFPDKSSKKKVLLVCGSLLISGSHGFAVTDPSLAAPCFELLPAMIEHIESGLLADGAKVVAVSVKDFYAAELASTRSLGDHGYHRMVIDPNMIVDLDPSWKSFDDYLNAMTAKYRLRANNSLKKIQDAEKREIGFEEIQRMAPEIEKLYLNVQKKAPVRIVRADIQYFLSLKEHLGDTFVFRIFILKGRLIAFTTGFRHERSYEAHFIGIDYDFNQEHALYQNILYDFIYEAIRFGAARLFYGRTAMEIKSTVGARPYSLTAYLKMNHRLLNKLITPFIPSAERDHWIQRNPFKE